jgi:hypothetical protein
VEEGLDLGKVKEELRPQVAKLLLNKTIQNIILKNDITSHEEVLDAAYYLYLVV